MLELVIVQVREELIEVEQLKPGDSIDYKRLTILTEKWNKREEKSIDKYKKICYIISMVSATDIYS